MQIKFWGSFQVNECSCQPYAHSRDLALHIILTVIICSCVTRIKLQNGAEKIGDVNYRKTASIFLALFITQTLCITDPTGGFVGYSWLVDLESADIRLLEQPTVCIYDAEP